MSRARLCINIERRERCYLSENGWMGHKFVSSLVTRVVSGGQHIISIAVTSLTKNVTVERELL